jgi:uncharacterized membrane protein YeaQ/YmgE (transglycosylase-associated protein family)
MGIIGVILLGIVAGYFAGRLVKGSGFGLWINLLLGVVGALLGSWIFNLIGITMGNGLLGSLISATVGAVAILLVVNLFSKK